jgi:endonuclease/exonuclease/phosphatase family metal-dependent hydrolase
MECYNKREVSFLGAKMSKTILRASFLFAFLVFLSLQGSENFKTITLLSSNQEMKTKEIHKCLNVSPDFGRIPINFIPNEGQVDDKALFYAKTSRYTLWLTKGGLIFDSTRRIKKESTESIRQNPSGINIPEDVKCERNVSRLLFINADRNPEVVPVDNTEHKVNYFIGNDESKWRSNIQTSRTVIYKELYPNIDLKVYGIEKQIEYDFVVKPGGEVADINFEYKDMKKTRIDEEGNLVVETEFGEIKHVEPVCYQVIGGERVEIKAEFKTKEDNTYGFEVEDYKKNYELIIDPLVLVYSTFLGGYGEESGRSIAVDSTGSIYVSGFTNSMDFPTKNSIQGSNKGEDDVFIAKINTSGTALVYSTYLGGSVYEGRCKTCIAVDSEGAAYVTGWTGSLDFPTKNPFQRTSAGEGDIFITKVNSAGSALIYSTYLGGSDLDASRGIAVDSEGAAYVTGYTLSIDFPTKNPMQVSNAGNYDVFIAKINTSGTALVYSTYLGGSEFDGSYGMAVDSKGAAYVTGITGSVDFPLKNPIQGSNAGGSDIFVTKINASGTALVYSTYLGGFGEDSCWGIAVDSGGVGYVTGDTGSVDFPLKNPIQGSNAGENDVFIAKINTSGKKLIYSTYLGGSDGDATNGIAVDSGGAAYVTGWTGSIDFPTKNPIQRTKAGDIDIFISKINSSGTALVYSTYLGSKRGEECDGIAVDSEGAAYVTGWTGSIDFPTKNPVQGSFGGGGRDAFITKIAYERIRIVSWNILNYPDMNEEPREEYFQSLLELLDPDILIVQEMASAAGVSQLLKEVLNPKKPKLYKAAAFFDGPDIDNALFYKKAKIGLISRQQIPTSFRDITEYKIKIKKGTVKGTEFKIYSVHFSEGAGAKKKRENEALTLRTYLDGLLPDELFLVCGSFNMMSSTEKAFKILTGNQVNNNGRLMDPIHKTGKWRDKSKHKRIHTESTRKSKFGGGTGGGLDDRYDMILISYGLEGNEKLIYSEGSYYVFGNDGKHLNKSINKPKNRIVSLDIADALYKASDHLPVIIDLVPQDESK